LANAASTTVTTTSVCGGSPRRETRLRATLDEDEGRHKCVIGGRNKERATGVEPATPTLGKLIDEGPEDYDPWT
jgi:hypothetical protein